MLLFPYHPMVWPVVFGCDAVILQGDLLGPFRLASLWPCEWLQRRHRPLSPSCLPGQGEDGARSLCSSQPVEGHESHLNAGSGAVSLICQKLVVALGQQAVTPRRSPSGCPPAALHPTAPWAACFHQGWAGGKGLEQRQHVLDQVSAERTQGIIVIWPGLSRV